MQVSGAACALGFQPGAPDNTIVLGTGFLRAYFTAYTYNATSRSSYVSFAPAAPGNSTTASELLEPSLEPWHVLPCAASLGCSCTCRRTGRSPVMQCYSIPRLYQYTRCAEYTRSMPSVVVSQVYTVG